MRILVFAARLGARSRTTPMKGVAASIRGFLQERKAPSCLRSSSRGRRRGDGFGKLIVPVFRRERFDLILLCWYRFGRSRSWAEATKAAIVPFSSAASVFRRPDACVWNTCSLISSDAVRGSWPTAGCAIRVSPRSPGAGTVWRVSSSRTLFVMFGAVAGIAVA